MTNSTNIFEISTTNFWGAPGEDKLYTWNPSSQGTSEANTPVEYFYHHQEGFSLTDTLTYHHGWMLLMTLWRLLPKRRSVCLMYSEAKHHQNVRVWSRERFTAGPSKETGGSCLKNPWNFPKLSANLFSRKDEGGAWLVIANLLGSNPFSRDQVM